MGGMVSQVECYVWMRLRLGDAGEVAGRGQRRRRRLSWSLCFFALERVGH